MEVEVISAKIHTVVYENGEPIVQGNDVLLQNNITKDLLFSPLTPELCEEFHLQIIYNEVAAEGTNANQPGGAQEQHTKVWTKPNILYLIEKIKENDHEFSNGIKKNVWTKIATECEATFKQKVTPLMCETKWKTLKRTYKTIRLNNNSTGQKRRYWEYYIGTLTTLTTLVVMKDRQSKIRTRSTWKFRNSCGHRYAIHFSHLLAASNHLCHY